MTQTLLQIKQFTILNSTKQLTLQITQLIKCRTTWGTSRNTRVEILQRESALQLTGTMGWTTKMVITRFNIIREILKTTFFKPKELIFTIRAIKTNLIKLLIMEDSDLINQLLEINQMELSLLSTKACMVQSNLQALLWEELKMEINMLKEEISMLQIFLLKK